MPIEIRELVIRASVSDSSAEQQRLEAQLARLKAQLLEECVTRIEERLGAHGER